MSRGPVCDPQLVCHEIGLLVPGAVIKSEAIGELIINLPDEQIGQFAELFQFLEAEKERLDVLNFGLSVTTMEDVFLK